MFVCNIVIMLNQYKVKELVTNILDVGDYYDPSLYGSSGIAMSNDHTIWIANVGNDSSVERNVTHYDLYGVKMSETLPFIDYESPDPLVPPSQQRQLIVDLLWLQKNVLAQQTESLCQCQKCMHCHQFWVNLRYNHHLRSYP